MDSVLATFSASQNSPHTDGDPVDLVTESFAQLDVTNQRRPVVDELKSTLAATDRSDLITENHQCFAPAQKFRDHWRIKPEPWSNFVRLLCGCRHFPLLLLQNPSKAHNLSFEEMRQGYTVNWIRLQLGIVGLSLDQVPILDICCLFSDNDLQAMDEDTRREAVEGAYHLVETIFGILELKIIVCCQCSTLGTWKEGREVWKPAENELARKLCSNIRDAEAKRAVQIDVEGHVMWAVKGFHPAYVRYTGNKEAVLIQLFKDMYQPCVEWERQMMAAAFEKMADANGKYISALGVLKSKWEDIYPDEKLLLAVTSSITDLITKFMTLKESLQATKK